MNLGVGVDIEEIARFKKVVSKGRLLNKMLTKKEACYCKSKPCPSQHIAARFAGKEAVIKAFGSLNKRLFFNNIEILNNKKGAPFVRILNPELNQKFNIKISLAHSKYHALAFAVVISGRNGKNLH